MTSFNDIRCALLKASPEARAHVSKVVSEAERSVQGMLEARLREADVARLGWRTEQETSAALRAELNRLQAELHAARELMAKTALALLGQSGMSANESKAA